MLSYTAIKSLKSAFRRAEHTCGASDLNLDFRNPSDGRTGGAEKITKMARSFFLASVKFRCGKRHSVYWYAPWSTPQRKSQKSRAWNFFSSLCRFFAGHSKKHITLHDIAAQSCVFARSYTFQRLRKRTQKPAFSRELGNAG